MDPELRRRLEHIDVMREQTRVALGLPVTTHRRVERPAKHVAHEKRVRAAALRMDFDSQPEEPEPREQRPTPAPYDAQCKDCGEESYARWLTFGYCNDCWDARR